jgi:hypothetical protein
MWKYEQEFRIDKPETIGETEKYFDLDNYKDWLEEQLTDCRKQLSIERVVGQSEQLVCDVCGSDDAIEAPHMGRNCNGCNPL